MSQSGGAPNFSYLLALLFSLFCLPVCAESHHIPRLIVVQCDGLTLDDIQGEATPHLRNFAETGAVGLMQCAVPHSDKPEIGLAQPFLPILKGERGIEAVRSDPKNPAGVSDDPIRLMQRTINADSEGVVVVLGDLTRAEEKRPQLSTAQYQEARDSALRRLNLFFYLLTEQLRAENANPDVILTATRPPTDTRLPTGVWGRLTPLLASGPHFPPGLLTSGTTHTTGVVALSDMSLTLSTLLAIPMSAQESGRPIGSKPTSPNGAERLAAVARMDFVSFLNGQGQVRIIVPLAIVCVSLVLAGLIARKRGGKVWGRRFAPALIFCLNLPSALLLAPLLIPPTLLEYGLRIAAWQAGLTLLSYLLASLPIQIGEGRADFPPLPASLSERPGEGPGVRFSPLVGVKAALIAALLTIALVVADILCGQPLMKDSLLSCGMLYGVRFYGIGNEYLGVLLGLVFTGGFALLDETNLQTDDRGRWLLVPFWVCLMVLMGWPGLGANAGSLITMGAGIAVSLSVLRGKKPVWWQAVIGMAGGLATAFLFAMLDAKLHPGGTVSHLGGAIQSASGGRGMGYLVEIATRKIGLNLSLLFTYWFLLAVIIVVGIILLARILIGEALRNALARRPWTARSLPATFAVGVAALIFKDTGVVTVTFLIGAVCLLLFVCAFVETSQKEEFSS